MCSYREKKAEPQELLQLDGYTVDYTDPQPGTHTPFNHEPTKLSPFPNQWSTNTYWALTPCSAFSCVPRISQVTRKATVPDLMEFLSWLSTYHPNQEL